MTFEKWETVGKRVEKVLRQNKNLYLLFFKTEKLFNCYNDFFCLRELLIHHLMFDEFETIAFKSEIKHFLKIKLKDLKLRKLHEDREAERKVIFGEIEKSKHSEWDDESDICLTDDEFPF